MIGPRIAALALVVCIGVVPLAQPAAAQTATVTTMAELRSAIGNAGITTININPGTYLLTSSGSGQLSISRSLTITNTGGGAVIIDAALASRVFDIGGAGITVTLTRLTIRRGRAARGGNIRMREGTLRVIECTVEDGERSGGVGGIEVLNGATLDLLRSTVRNNQEGINGARNSTLLITNSTISANYGGGIDAGISVSGTATITNSTIASQIGGGLANASGTVTLRNTIVADNSGGQISGTVVSNGHNVVEGGCAGCLASDQTIDPRLGPLATNGGPTRTHGLLAGSVATNAALNSDAPVTDQRGFSRPQGATADIGAFESGTDLAVTKGVSNTTPAEGAVLSYSVTLSGAGPDGATGVTLTDLLPAGVTFQSYTATQGSYASGTGVWTVGNVASGGTATLTLNASVNSGTSGSTIINTASLTALNEAESSTANNVASQAITIMVITVSVTPDGGQNLQRLPSNGTSYTFTFSVTNTGGSPADFDLLASRSPGTAIGIDSVNGAAGDSTRISGLPAGGSRSINVVYSVAGVGAGVLDTLRLRARSVSSGAITDSGYVDLTVVRPSLTLAKTVAPLGASAPGTDLTYAVTLTNGGTSTAGSVVLVDTLPADVQFKVGSVVNNMPSGVSVAVEYSNDGGLSWIYVPASGACSAPAGYDACVNRIRWRLLNDLSPTAPDNSGSVSFLSRIR